MPRAELQAVITAKDRASRTFRKLSGQMKRTEKTTHNLNSKFGRMIGTLRGLGPMRLATALGGLYALRVGIRNTVGAAVDFENAFAGVRKTIDATEGQFKKLSENFRMMAKQIPVSVKELAKIGELAGQLGVPIHAVTKFTEVIAKLGVTTNLTTEAAAMQFSRLANIIEMPIEDVDRLGAAVVELGNNFATTEAEVMNFSLRIAATAKMAGFTEADILAIGAAFTSVGVRAEMGGSAFMRVIMNMQEAVATGTKNLEVYAQVAGMTAKRFAKSFKEDASEAFEAFISGLGSGGDIAFKIFDELSTTSIRVKQAFLSLAGASGLLDKAFIKGNEAFAENIALNEEAAKRFATTQSQMDLARNALYDAGITIGNILLPAVNLLMRGFSKLGSVVTDVIEIMKQYKNIIISVSATITIRLIPSLKRMGVVALRTAWKMIAAYGPLLIKGAVIVGLVTAIWWVAYNWDKVGKSIWGAMKNIGRLMGNLGAIMLNSVSTAFSRVGKTIRKWMNERLQDFNTFLKKIPFYDGEFIKFRFDIDTKKLDEKLRTQEILWGEFDGLVSKIGKNEAIQELVKDFNTLKDRILGVGDSSSDMYHKFKETQEEIAKKIAETGTDFEGFGEDGEKAAKKVSDALKRQAGELEKIEGKLKDIQKQEKENTIEFMKSQVKRKQSFEENLADMVYGAEQKRLEVSKEIQALQKKERIEGRLSRKDTERYAELREEAKKLYREIEIGAKALTKGGVPGALGAGVVAMAERGEIERAVSAFKARQAEETVAQGAKQEALEARRAEELAKRNEIVMNFDFSGAVVGDKETLIKDIIDAVNRTDLLTAQGAL